jgi:hypothetical protein
MCDGMGTCVPGMTSSCNEYACGVSACQTACGTNDAVGDLSCAPTYYCDGVGGGSCQMAKASGATCTRNGECQSGKCNTGVKQCM